MSRCRRLNRANTSFGALKQIDAGLLNVGYVPRLRGYRSTRVIPGDTVRNGQQSVVALDITALKAEFGPTIAEPLATRGRHDLSFDFVEPERTAMMCDETGPVTELTMKEFMSA